MAEAQEQAAATAGGGRRWLQDTVALVTSAATALGRSYAEALVDAGAYVVVADARLKQLEALLKEHLNSRPPIHPVFDDDAGEAQRTEGPKDRAQLIMLEPTSKEGVRDSADVIWAAFADKPLVKGVAVVVNVLDVAEHASVAEEEKDPEGLLQRHLDGVRLISREFCQRWRAHKMQGVLELSKEFASEEVVVKVLPAGTLLSEDVLKV
eukprot:SM000020S05974  [mRNA]  locus=s20:119232:120415:- [translate_table: standard]